MNYRKTLFVAGLAAASFAVAGQDAQLIRRSFAENSTETYKVESKADQSLSSAALGDMKMAMTTGLTYQLKIGKVDASAGTTDAELTTTLDKIEADGPLGDQMKQQQVKPLVQKGTIDNRGRVKLADIKTGDMLSLVLAGSQSGTLATTFVELPEKPVKVGDSWDVLIPKGLYTDPEDQKITAKLVGEKKVGDHDAWIVKFSGDVNSLVDTSKLPPSDTPSPLGQLVIKGVTSYSGEGTVDKASGKTLTLELTGKSKSTVESQSMGMSADISGPITFSVKLQE